MNVITLQHHTSILESIKAKTLLQDRPMQRINLGSSDGFGINIYLQNLPAFALIKHHLHLTTACFQQESLHLQDFTSNYACSNCNFAIEA